MTYPDRCTPASGAGGGNLLQEQADSGLPIFELYLTILVSQEIVPIIS
jgi:hypothetical protein